MVQVNKIFQSLTPPGNMPTSRLSEGHADHHFLFIGHPQNQFDRIFVESADPAGPIAQLGGLERKIGQ